MRLNKSDGVGQTRHHGIGACGTALAVPAVDKDGRHAGPLRRLDVSPPVANADARCKVESQPRGGVEDHSRSWLAALAIVGIVVGANHDLVQRQLPPQRVMHPVNFVAGLPTPGDVWLVGYDDQSEAPVSQPMTSLCHAGQ